MGLRQQISRGKSNTHISKPGDYSRCGPQDAQNLLPASIPEKLRYRHKKQNQTQARQNQGHEKERRGHRVRISAAGDGKAQLTEKILEKRLSRSLRSELGTTWVHQHGQQSQHHKLAATDHHPLKGARPPGANAVHSEPPYFSANKAGVPPVCQKSTVSLVGKNPCRIRSIIPAAARPV